MEVHVHRFFFFWGGGDLSKLSNNYLLGGSVLAPTGWKYASVTIWMCGFSQSIIFIV